MKKVTAKQFVKVIGEMSELTNPKTLMVYGVPGIGKTYAIKNTAEKLGREYISLSLGRLEAYDIKGIPDNTGTYVRWVPPEFWRTVIETKGNCIVHFDEFTLAQEDVQGAVLDIVLEKRVDNLKLPEKTMFIVSGNMGGDDGTTARPITSALTGGRGLVFQMVPPTVSEWVEFQKPVEYISAFLKANQKSIYTGPNLKEPFEPWTCPRAWSAMDDILKERSKKGVDLSSDAGQVLMIELAEAMLSPKTVVEFRDFMKDELLDVAKLVRNDEKEWAKYKRVRPVKQAYALDEAVKYFDPKESSEFKNKEELKEALETFLDNALKAKTEPEALVSFTSKLLSLDPFFMDGIKMGGVPMPKYHDKLLAEKINDRR
jgi:hypothetical protein